MFPHNLFLSLHILSFDEMGYLHIIIFETFDKQLKKLHELVFAINHSPSFQFVRYFCPADTFKIN